MLQLQDCKKIADEHMHAMQCVCAHTHNIRQAYRQQVWISETELNIHKMRAERATKNVTPKFQARGS